MVVKVAKLRESSRADGSHYAWHFKCPACRSVHQCDNRWGFNGDLEKPTFQGSVLVHAVTHGTPEAPVERPRCHSVITDGKIAYSQDCDHAMAGQIADLPDWEP